MRSTDRQADLIDTASRPVETDEQSSVSHFKYGVSRGSKTMTNKQIVVALTIALIATPAFAKGGDAKAGKDAAASVDQRKYCISYDNIVGSRVSRTECKTKEEWARQRVDVDKLLKD
jgi:hypothetical protein